MEKRRLEYIDVAKGVGIIAIMLGHMGFADAGGANVIRPLVNQFHVPIFYVIAGMFLSTRKPLGVFIGEKARRLLVPYVVTCAVMGVFVVACQAIGGATKPPTIWESANAFLGAVLWGAGIPHGTLPQGVGYVGAIWFLEALFVALLETRLLVSARLNDGVRLGISVALALVALGTQRLLLLPFNVQPGLFGGLYVMIGYLYRTYVGLDWRPCWWLLAALCVCCGVSYAYGLVVSCVMPSVAHGLLGFGASLCACLLVLGFSQLVAERLAPLAHVLSFFGQHSLTVLCVHLCCLNLGMRLVALSVSLQLFVSPTANLVRAVDLVLQLSLCALVAKGHALMVARTDSGRKS